MKRYTGPNFQVDVEFHDKYRGKIRTSINKVIKYGIFSEAAVSDTLGNVLNPSDYGVVIETPDVSPIKTGTHNHTINGTDGNAVASAMGINTHEVETVEVKDEDTTGSELSDDVVSASESTSEPSDTSDVVVPADRVCPHCGSKARTEKSYINNHGRNCHMFLGA